MENENIAEEIRETFVSTQPGYKGGVVLKLLIPRLLAKKLKIKRGRKCTLICKPMVSKVINGDRFDLIYSFNGHEYRETKWKEVDKSDYIETEEIQEPAEEVETKESKFDITKILNEVENGTK